MPQPLSHRMQSRWPLTFEVVEDGELVDAVLEESLASLAFGHCVTNSCVQQVAGTSDASGLQPLIAHVG